MARVFERAGARGGRRGRALFSAPVAVDALPHRDRPRRGRLAHRRRREAHSRFPRQQRPSARPRPSEGGRGDPPRDGDPALLHAPLRQPDCDCARPSADRNRAGGARQDAVRAKRIGGGRHGAEACALRHRPAQDAVVLGFVPRRQSRRDRRRRRSPVPPRPRADDARRRTPAAARSRAPLLRRRPSVRPPRRPHRLCARRPRRRRGADRRAAALDDGRARRRSTSGRACANPARGTGRC